MLADMMSGLLGGGSAAAPKAHHGTEWLAYRPWPDPGILPAPEHTSADNSEEGGPASATAPDGEDLDLD